MRDRHAVPARLHAVLLSAVLILVTLAPAASAAPFTWVRRAALSGSGAYGTLSAATGTASTSTVVVDAGDGVYVFAAGASGSRRVAALTTTGTGDGYATSVLDGSIEAGTWTVTAALTVTGLPASEAEGSLVAGLYAVSATGTRRLTTLRSADVLAAGSGSRTVTLTGALGRLVLRQERLVAELYLAVQEDDAPATWRASLAEGGSGDAVTAPGPLARRPLDPPRRARVGGATDRQLTVTWQVSPDVRTTGYVVQRAASPSGPWTDRSGTLVGTSYNDTGLTNRTRWYYRVLATDGTNRSTATNVAAGASVDQAAPSAPASVAVTPNGSQQLTVTWPASASADAATYVLERATAPGGPFGVRVEGLVTRSYTETGLPAGSTWYYRIRTVDDDGLVSGPSGSTSGTVAPEAPQGLITESANRAILLSWDSSSDAISRYRIERATTTGAFTQVATSAGTSFTDTGLTNDTAYRYRIRAEDPAGALSSYSAIVTDTPVDRGRPAPPVGLAITPNAGPRNVTLTWEPSPTSGIAGYNVSRFVDGVETVLVTGDTTRTLTDRGLPIGIRHRYQVVAVDLSGRTSLPVEVAYQFAPAAPTRLRATAVTESTVTLAWDAVAGTGVTYRVFRGVVANPATFAARSEQLSTTSFDDAGLILGEPAYYTVQAYGRDREPSGPSNVIRVDPVDEAPTPPIGASVDDLGVGGTLQVRWLPNPEPDIASYTLLGAANPGGPYTVVATGLTEATYVQTGLTDGVPFHYRVVAVDAGGNTSPVSATATGVPQDTRPPDPPGRPGIEVLGDTLRVAWAGSIEAASYDIGRSTTPGGPYTTVATTTSRSFVDTGVVRGTRYYYTVVARDAAGNGTSSPEANALIGIPSPSTTGGAGGATSGGTTAGITTGFSTGGLSGGLPTGGLGGPIPVRELDRGAFPEPTATSGTTARTTGDSTPTGDDGPDGPEASDGTPGTGATDRFDVPIADIPRVVAEGAAEAARTLRLPLILLALIALYLAVQGRIDREVVLEAVDDDVRATGGDDDDVEFRL